MAVASASIISAITVIGQAIVALCSFLLAIYSAKNDKATKKKEDIDNKKSRIDDVCDNGTLDQLIDATKDLGEAKK